MCAEDIHTVDPSSPADKDIDHRRPTEEHMYLKRRESHGSCVAPRPRSLTIVSTRILLTERNTFLAELADEARLTETNARGRLNQDTCAVVLTRRMTAECSITQIVFAERTGEHRWARTFVAVVGN